MPVETGLALLFRGNTLIPQISSDQPLKKSEVKTASGTQVTSQPSVKVAELPQALIPTKSEIRALPKSLRTRWVKVWTQANKVQPKDIAQLRILAVMVKRGRLIVGNALPLYEKAVQSDPTDNKLLGTMQLAVKCFEPRRAMNALKDAVKRGELSLIRHALKTDNPTAAIRTYNRLAQVANKHPEGSRITSLFMKRLVQAAGQGRFGKGTEGNIGPVHAWRTARAIVAMSEVEYRDLQGLLLTQPSDTHRVMTLKALGARVGSFDHKLRRGSKATSPSKQAVFKDLGTFSQQIAKMSATDVIRHCTLGRQPTERTRSDADPRIKQFYTHSCTPALIDTFYSEVDPIKALALRTTDDRRKSQVRHMRKWRGTLRLFQKNSLGYQLSKLEGHLKTHGDDVAARAYSTLKAYAGSKREPNADEIKASRYLFSRLSEDQLRDLGFKNADAMLAHLRDDSTALDLSPTRREKNAKELHSLVRRLLGNLSRSRRITQADKKYIKHRLGRGRLTSQTRTALTRMWEKLTSEEHQKLASLGFNNQEQFIQGSVQITNSRNLRGVYVTSHLSTLSRITHTRFRKIEIPRGPRTRDLDRIEGNVRKSFDISIGIKKVGTHARHAMLVTNVRRRNGTREFLIQDPITGRALWSTDKDIKNGSLWVKIVAPHRLPFYKNGTIRLVDYDIPK